MREEGTLSLAEYFMKLYDTIGKKQQKYCILLLSDQLLNCLSCYRCIFFKKEYFCVQSVDETRRYPLFTSLQQLCTFDQIKNIRIHFVCSTKWSFHTIIKQKYAEYQSKICSKLSPILCSHSI